MADKKLPIEMLIAGGAALLGSFLPLVTVGGLSAFGVANVNAWNSGPMFGFLPNIIPFLFVVALGVFAWLKSEGKWSAPPVLVLVFAIYAVSHLALLFLSSLLNQIVGPGIGLIVGVAAAGFALFIVLTKKQV